MPKARPNRGGGRSVILYSATADLPVAEAVSAQISPTGDPANTRSKPQVLLFGAAIEPALRVAALGSGDTVIRIHEAHGDSDHEPNEREISAEEGLEHLLATLRSDGVEIIVVWRSSDETLRWSPAHNNGAADIHPDSGLPLERLVLPSERTNVGAERVRKSAASIFRWRTGYSRLAEILGIALSIPAIIALVASFVRGDEVRVLEGDVTVAVIPFSAQSEKASASSVLDDLSLTLWEAVRQDLEKRVAQTSSQVSTLVVDTLSPTESDHLEEGLGATEFKTSVESAARDHHAAVTLTASVSSDLRSVYPVLFVANSAVPDAAEYAGLFDLGGPITTRNTLDTSAARSKVREELVARSGAVVEFILGVSRYENGELDQAEKDLNTANELWPGGHGADVVDLFLGNIALKRTKYDEAARHFQDGLARSGSAESRLRLGLLEAQFHSGRGESCGTQAEVAEVATVRSGYSELASRSDARVSTVFKGRVAFGLARTTLCLANGGADWRFEDAAPHYLDVLELYRSEQQLLRDAAAESYGGLGVVAQHATPTWDSSVCDSAKVCFTRAADLAIDPDRRALYERLAAQAG